MSDSAFRTRWPFTNPHAQCILASTTTRSWWLKRRFPELAAHQWVSLQLSDGTELIGQYNEPAGTARDALLILFHGWEGSSESNYMLAASGAAVRAGYPVFRLNFRDHGPSHQLNEDLFHSCRIDEVVEATQRVIERFGRQQNRLAGFSLGGNFALRTALQAPEKIPALEAVLAFSPVISPHACMSALESTRFYEYYFVRKWRESLRLKQRHFPHRYEMDAALNIESIRAMTDHLVAEFAGFNCIDDYLHGYSVAGDRLAGLALPAHIITAKDDPIIPLEDFHQLPRQPALSLEITEHGGHCAWLEGIRPSGWMEQRLLSWLTQPVPKPNN
jgi:hypothetical protein